jgi:hypothetical protein
MKLPVNTPPEIVHKEESKRPDGEDVRLHVVPSKPDLETETAVPAGPDVGLKTSAEGAAQAVQRD